MKIKVDVWVINGKKRSYNCLSMHEEVFKNFARVKKDMNRLFRETGLPGVSISIRRQGGKRVYEYHE